MAKKIEIVNTLWGEVETLVTTKDIGTPDEQWDIWQKQNPKKDFEHIDEQSLKEIIDWQTSHPEWIS